MNPRAVLCYVRHGFAHFTTQSLDKQWGDDWNDAPYEHNAGTPYRPCWHREGGKQCDCEICERDWNADGTPKWKVFAVPFTGGFDEPCDNTMNSPHSVESINRHKAAPWLICNDHRFEVRIHAGADYQQFCALVESVGGTVYEPRAPVSRGLGNTK